MIELHAAVFVNVHERAGLVEMRRRKRDAEFDGRQRNAALQDGAGRVEFPDRFTTRDVVRALFELIDDFVNNVVFDRLPIVRDVSILSAVEVDAADLKRVLA